MKHLSQRLSAYQGPWRLFDCLIHDCVSSFLEVTVEDCTNMVESHVYEVQNTAGSQFIFYCVVSAALRSCIPSYPIETSDMFFYFGKLSSYCLAKVFYEFNIAWKWLTVLAHYVPRFHEEWQTVGHAAFSYLV